MNLCQSARWKSEVLDEVFVAMASSPELATCLVFKGARVLARRLPSAVRQSLDIDSNLSKTFVANYPGRDTQRRRIELLIREALSRHFDRQDPVRYQLERLSVKLRPQTEHPQGWNAFDARLGVKDLSLPTVSNLPVLEIDIAAPEELLESSLEPLQVGARVVEAYSLTRIAGEKMRAFLSSLPAYRRKAKKPGDAVRVKDLYDLTHIFRERTLPDNAMFWETSGQEFRAACKSRFVDCHGIDSFKENWTVTRRTYEVSGVIDNNEVRFEEAERTLETIAAFLSERRLIPFDYPWSSP